MSDAIFVLAVWGQVSSAGIPIIRTIEPVPASPWILTFDASCRQTRVRIEGYGPVRPARRTARIEINGRPAIGEEASALAHDLSNKRAVYRMEALCSQTDNRWLQLRIHSGEKSEDGTVRYLVGSAEIAGSKLIYRGLAPSNAETFWFR